MPWIFWTQLIAGGAVQLLHFFTVPETRATILCNREAKRRRKAGDDNIYGPNEIRGYVPSRKELFTIWGRPFYMLVSLVVSAFLHIDEGRVR